MKSMLIKNTLLIMSLDWYNKRKVVKYPVILRNSLDKEVHIGLT
jgi:hypothetical protein